MIERPNILIVCARNKKRSRTAEHIFKNDNRFTVRSAGLSASSNRKLSEGDLRWADVVCVMETNHRTRIWDVYGHLELAKIEVLHIPDDYEFMDKELVELLEEKISEVLHNFYNES